MNNLTKNFSFLEKSNINFAYKDKIINSLKSIEEKLKSTETFERTILNECRGIYENILFQMAISENINIDRMQVKDIKHELTHNYDIFDSEGYTALNYVAGLSNDGSHSSKELVEKRVESYTILQTLKGIQVLLRILIKNILHIPCEISQFMAEPYGSIRPNILKAEGQKIIEEENKKFFSTNLLVNKRQITKLLKFKETIYRIPIYQRGYAWMTHPHITDFLGDIDNCVKKNNSNSHYFGVIAKKRIIDHTQKFLDYKVEKIIDGQQRLTTSMLFLCAIRDVLQEKWQIVWQKNKILWDFFSVNANRKMSTIFDIPGKNINKKVLDFILDGETNETNLTNERKKTRYYENYKFMYDTISEKKSSEDVMNMLTAFDECFEVAEIDFDQEHTTNKNEMEIFEDLNSKGKPLSFYELIKNFLFNMCSEEILVTHEEEIVDYFNDSFIFPKTPKIMLEKNIEKEMENFLESYIHYETSEEITTNAKEKNALDLIGKALKNNFPKSDNLDMKEYKEIVDHLKRYFDIYVSVRFSEMNLPFVIYTGIKKAIDLLDNKKKTPIYPMIYLIADGLKISNNINQNFSITDMTRIFNSVLLLIQPLIKNMYIIGQGDSSINRKYYEQIKKFRAGISINNAEKNFLTFKEIAQAIDAEVGTDDRFKMHIMAMKKTSWATTSLLQIVEWQMRKIAPTKDNINRNTVTLEHIMPQKGLSKWKEELLKWGENPITLAELYKENLHLLGNLIILSGSQNSLLGNKTFFEKKKELSETKNVLFENSNSEIDISRKDKWTFEDIQIRTKALANYIISIWMKEIK